MIKNECTWCLWFFFLWSFIIHNGCDVIWNSSNKICTYYIRKPEFSASQNSSRKRKNKKKTVKFFFPFQIIKCTIESRVLSPNSNTCILFFFLLSHEYEIQFQFESWKMKSIIIKIMVFFEKGVIIHIYK